MTMQSSVSYARIVQHARRYGLSRRQVDAWKCELILPPPMGKKGLYHPACIHIIDKIESYDARADVEVLRFRLTLLNTARERGRVMPLEPKNLDMREWYATAVERWCTERMNDIVSVSLRDMQQRELIVQSVPALQARARDAHRPVLIDARRSTTESGPIGLVRSNQIVQSGIAWTLGNGLSESTHDMLCDLLNIQRRYDVDLPRDPIRSAMSSLQHYRSNVRDDLLLFDAALGRILQTLYTWRNLFKSVLMWDDDGLPCVVQSNDAQSERVLVAVMFGMWYQQLHV